MTKQTEFKQRITVTIDNDIGDGSTTSHEFLANLNAVFGNASDKLTSKEAALEMLKQSSSAKCINIIRNNAKGKPQGHCNFSSENKETPPTETEFIDNNIKSKLEDLGFTIGD